MMASSKDISIGRGTSQSRSTLSPSMSSLPRQNYLRTHSHSVSGGAANAASRISRRKSSTVNPINVAALTAAVKDMPYSSSLGDGTRSRMEALGLSQSPKDSVSSIHHGSAVDDGPLSLIENGKIGTKSRTRRSSDGTRLTKEGSKLNVGELRCETCGKGYKHGSCLTKHLWEHTPEWALTSKLLISKHQQVQLLEAASVLVQMNQDGPPLASYLPQIEDENSSDSPAASGSSDPVDEDDQSSRTSTPSLQDDSKVPHYLPRGRQDSYGDAFSRSYQSSGFAASAPNDANGFAMNRQWSSSSRPSTAQGQSDEETDLTAAAQGLVNCSLGTPKSGSTYLPRDIPPVPKLPARFATTNSSTMDMDLDQEDDEGVFGTMEQ